VSRRKRHDEPVWRPLHGILLLDKPSGVSSNAALQKARHLFRADKGGHTGSLDPLATGLLPLCFGEATKIAGSLLGADKAYETEAVLGQTTDTEDADGVVLAERPVPALTAAQIEAALRPLQGRIRQRPPAYSAIKRDGVPAYRRARDGEAVALEEREVEVHRIELLDREGHRLRLRITCGSGTYVRSLVRDLGEALGCGAHVGSLRRLWVEPFRRPRMWTLEQLAALDEPARDALLLPIEEGLRHLPALPVDAATSARLRQGQRIAACGAAAGDYVLWDGARALGRGRVDGTGMLHPERLFRDADS
jgi:tRNA pseudouridine55 synthase